ncbi:MAG TPA: hypothetical protein VFD42_09810, partial [Chloroflexota bacterium]|nr:hypothetical protein [Chloroflexota bacterium]
MTAVSGETRRGVNRGSPAAPWLIAWNVLAAGAFALSLCMLILGRTWPTQASLPWLVAYGITFGLGLGWLFRFSRDVLSRGLSHPLSLVARVEGLLLAVSAATALAIYLSDSINHEISQFLYPTPAVVLLLLALGTAIAQQALLEGNGSITRASATRAIRASGRWAIPLCLLLVGLIQDASYLWVIGNDFTRYWGITDGIATGSGYVLSENQGVYREAGMYRYSIEFPMFPLLLLSFFRVVGHDTLGAHMPALVANTLLPLVLYAFYCRAGLARPIAFLAACAVATFPFLRLYTLNAPVPDSIFMACLVAAGWALLRLIGGLDTVVGQGLIPHRNLTAAEGMPSRGLEAAATIPYAHQPALDWALFGLLAGLTMLTRAEGTLFVAFLFAALLPHILNWRLYLAGAITGAMAGAFAIVVYLNAGVIWPRNAGSSFGLENVAGNLDWIERRSLRDFANALGMERGDFVAMVWVFALLVLAGTLWLASKRWQLALFPIATSVHTFLIYAVDPRVSGADQWFDYFRHLSYGLPFAVLPVFLAMQAGAAHLARHPRPRHEAVWRIPVLLVVASLSILVAYQLYLLAQPSLTHGGGATQLLTSDTWVNGPDMVKNRYALPVLEFSRQEGVMMIDPANSYVPRHLDSVKAHFEP